MFRHQEPLEKALLILPLISCAFCFSGERTTWRVRSQVIGALGEVEK